MQQTIHRPGGRRPTLAGAVAAALTLGLSVGLSACGGGGDAADESAEARAGQSVTVEPAASRTLSRTIVASGTISAWQEVPVGAETGGLTAVAVRTDEGQYVRQGQVLVQLNDQLLRAQLRQQEAQVASARARLDEAEAALARAQELRERGFLAPAALDTRVAEQATARAALASAEAARSETQARLAQASIRAPVSGLVIRRSVTQGQIVSSGTELFRIVRDGRLELNAEVPETELALVRPGQGATVASEDVGETTGQVRIVTPEVDPQSRLGLARIALNGAGGFRPGMFARARIDVGAAPAVTVPTGAVLYRDNHPAVFVLDDESRARLRTVTVTTRTDEWTAVEGVAAGERVVVRGAGFLNDGDRVSVSAPRAASAAPAPAAAD